MNDHSATEFAHPTELTGSERLDDDRSVEHRHRAGGFPAGEVDLQFQFMLSGGVTQHRGRALIGPVPVQEGEVGVYCG